MKRLFIILGCFFSAIVIVAGTTFFTRDGFQVLEDSTSQQSIVPQEIIRVDQTSHTVYRLYDGGQLVGVLRSQRLLDSFLEQVYHSRYEETFPNSKVALGKDVYLTSEESYEVYENCDQEILKYLSDYGIFTLRAVGIEFSDENGVYAEIYTSNESIYEEAMQSYLGFFVDSEDLQRLQNGERTSELTSYGSQTVSVSISQTITMKEVYASPEEIKVTAEEVLEYLEYGDSTEREYYTVEQYDTVAGVGSKNHGLSATQVMNINRDKISSVDQVLTVGEELCVTYFSSPIDIIVTNQTMRKEDIYPDTVYVEDSSIREGETLVRQYGTNGSRNTLYSERWINGVLVSGTKISSVDTLQPQSEIVAVGTYVVPGVGTGVFRWPTDNVYISCHWGCYYGHQAIDIQNSYDNYGALYAADRGVVEEVGYNGINGNYIVINHNNGYETYYGHLYAMPTLEIGSVVDKGEVIGQIGMTGRATGPHTHFFIIENGNRRNPCNGFLDCTGL